ERHRIVDFVADAALVEMPLQGVAIGTADHELIVDVALVWWLDRQRDPVGQVRLAEERAVTLRVRAARIGPRGEMWRFDPQDCRLKRVHPEIAADEVMVVLG